MPLTLQHGDTTQSLAAWGFEDVSTRELSQQMGELTATIPGDMLAALPWHPRAVLRCARVASWNIVRQPPIAPPP